MKIKSSCRSSLFPSWSG